jgi:hypothetical protein
MKNGKKRRAWTTVQVRTLEVDGTKEKAGGENREEPKAE